MKTYSYEITSPSGHHVLGTVKEDCPIAGHEHLVLSRTLAMKDFFCWFPTDKKTEKNIAKAKAWAQDFIQMLERSEAPK
jgi:hypothetical protein